MENEVEDEEEKEREGKKKGDKTLSRNVCEASVRRRASS